MKTIEEAKNKLETSIDGMNGFYRGVLWANEWIEVEDELPEESFIEYGSQFGINLLIKCPNGAIFLVDRKWSEDHNDFVWRYKDGGRVYEVVSWRPIERK